MRASRIENKWAIERIVPADALDVRDVQRAGLSPVQLEWLGQGEPTDQLQSAVRGDVPVDARVAIRVAQSTGMTDLQRTAHGRVYKRLTRVRIGDGEEHPTATHLLNTAAADNL